MAKLTRVPLKPFAGSALKAEVSQFGSVVEGSKLHTLDIATIQGLNSWLAGFSKALISGNRYPSYQEMNGVLKVLSYQGAYALQEGIPEYDSATTYYIGSIVKKTGTFELYGSLTNDNVGNALTVDTEWVFLCNLSASNTKLVSCSTAAATVDKAITLTGVPLSDGLTLLVGFTNANTASSITINLNATGAKALVDKRGNTPDFSNKAGEKVLITYDLTNTRWILLEAEFYNARMAMPSSSYIDLTLGVTGSTYTAPADGCVNIKKTALTGVNCVGLINNTVGGFINVGYGQASITDAATFIFVKKNDTIIYIYTGNNNSNPIFRFYYAEGSKP